MSMYGKLSSVVIAGFAVAAVAVLPTTALAQQTDSVAASPSDTAKSGGVRVIRSDADTSAGEAVKPAGQRINLPRSAIQQLMRQMVGGVRPGGTQATPRAGQGADSTGGSKKSSDSTAADASND